MQFILATLVLLLIGCSTAIQPPPPANLQSLQPSAAPAPSEQEYKIQVGDQLDVKFFYNSELNEQVIVRPDGRISLQLVHEIPVVGMTPAELTQLLTQKYTPELQRPEVAVIVRQFGAQKIFVDGEVNKPGLVPILGIMTALQAISQAGGVKDTGQTREVIIIRRGVENRPMAFSIDLDKALDGTDMRQDISLAPFDIVYVPRSTITNINIWVDQYIRKNIPIPISFQYTF